MTDVTAQGFSAPPAREPTAIRVGDAFTKARNVFVARWATYCGIMAIGYSPFGIAIALTTYAAMRTGAASASPRDPSMIITIAIAGIVGAIIALICLLIAPAAIYFGVAQQVAGRRFSFGESLGAAFRRALVVFATTFLVSLLGLLGLVLLIAPG